MKSFNSVFVPSDPKNRIRFCSLFVIVSLICGVYLIGDALISKEYKDKLTRWGLIYPTQKINTDRCKNQCRPHGSEALPERIVVKNSDLELRSLWSPTKLNLSDFTMKEISKRSMGLLAMAVGIKQKEIVNKIVQKFPLSEFVIMLFHYDGILDGWRDLVWSDNAIHVSAVNQTKWWFAKRFLHPDIVADYEYIFLWDEDLGVKNFDPKRYLSIVKEEGLHISQPALDPAVSDIHHPLTVRRRGPRVHRRYYKLKGTGRCDEHSTGPPCIGWVEMMAPVFSKEAWRCVWYMIQNDLVHAWGLDRQLGYCAQGNRMNNVGVIDSEYIVHLGLPTLGVSNCQPRNITQNTSLKQGSSKPEAQGSLDCHADVGRSKVRMKSYIDMQTFKKRWDDAVKGDQCWVDPYPQGPQNLSAH